MHLYLITTLLFTIFIHVQNTICKPVSSFCTETSILILSNTLISANSLAHAYDFTNNSTQELKLPCDFEYTVTAEKNLKDENYEASFVNFKWDISKIDSNCSVTIEIVKIFDCFIGLDGNQTEAYVFLDLKNEDLIHINSLQIKHIKMLAKCFKWRVVLKSDTCLEKSDWNFYSFLD